MQENNLEKFIPTAGHYFPENGILSQKGTINLMIE